MSIICKFELSVIELSKIFIILSFCFFSTTAEAHSYFFAFAEVEYNEVNGKIEATITATAHDLERYLQKKNILQKNLSDCTTYSVSLSILEKVINQHFAITINPNDENSIMDGNELFMLQLEGIEIQMTGTIQIYLSGTVKRALNSVDLFFDLLMDEYPEQQNKATFIYREYKETLVFLPTKKSETIELK